MRRWAVMILLGVTPARGLTQSQNDALPTFDVASVKLAKELVVNGWTSRGAMPPIRPDQESLNLPSVSLISLIERAYNVQPPDTVSGPLWLTTERYEIVAKGRPGARGQLPAMLQNLLAQRFHLHVHWENKEVHGYALMVSESRRPLTPADPATPKSSTSSASGHFAYSRITLTDFSAALGRMMALPVVDATGIQGEFNITLDAAPDSLPGLNSPSKAIDSQFPSIFGALKQLGFNLEQRKLTVKMLTVDSADKIPTGN